MTKQSRIVGEIDLYTAETKRNPLPWQIQGLQYTRSGYGSKIPTSLMVKHNGKWRRIYVCQWSNSGTAYITQGKNWLVCVGEPREESTTLGYMQGKGAA